MFAIANKVDNVHTIPWIGFQSWRASGRKVYVISCLFNWYAILSTLLQAVHISLQTLKSRAGEILLSFVE